MLGVVRHLCFGIRSFVLISCMFRLCLRSTKSERKQRKHARPIAAAALLSRNRTGEAAALGRLCARCGAHSLLLLPVVCDCSLPYPQSTSALRPSSYSLRSQIHCSHIALRDSNQSAVLIVQAQLYIAFVCRPRYEQENGPGWWGGACSSSTSGRSSERIRLHI